MLPPCCRILHGFFPTYRDSPLPPKFDRILQVGDASGIQSPLRYARALRALCAWGRCEPWGNQLGG